MKSDFECLIPKGVIVSNKSRYAEGIRVKELTIDELTLANEKLNHTLDSTKNEALVEQERFVQKFNEKINELQVIL